MEESSNFLSVKRNKKGKESQKHFTKEQSNLQIINQQKLIIIYINFINNNIISYNYLSFIEKR